MMTVFTSRFRKHMWWILTVGLTAPLVAIAANLTVFTPNTVISSSAVNANFQALADRITTLEGSKTTVTLVLDNVAATGVGLPIPAATATPISFTTAGGPLLVLASGSAYSATDAHLDVVVQIDGAPIGHLQEYTNEFGSHKAFPTRTFKITPSAGSHNVQLLAGTTTTVADLNDHFSVTVIELAH